jgi:hypothetical protein
MGDIDIFCFLHKNIKIEKIAHFFTKNDSSLERKFLFRFSFFFHNILIVLKKLRLKKISSYFGEKMKNSENLEKVKIYF